MGFSSRIEGSELKKSLDTILPYLITRATFGIRQIFTLKLFLELKKSEGEQILGVSNILKDVQIMNGNDDNIIQFHKEEKPKWNATYAKVALGLTSFAKILFKRIKLSTNRKSPLAMHVGLVGPSSNGAVLFQLTL